MTVRELIEHLQTFNPDALVVCSRYSDVMLFEKDEVTEARVLFQGGCPQRYERYDWHVLLSPHDEETMDPAQKPFVQTVVHFEGN